VNIVLTNDAKDIAGGENFVLYLADGLREKGHNIFIAPLINSELSEKTKELGYTVIDVPYAQGGKEFKAVNVLYQQLKNKHINIVHSNSNFDRTIAAFAGKFIRAKNFASIHSCMSISHNITHKFRNKYIIDHFISDGLATKKIMVGKDGISVNKISVVHIGVPENMFLFSESGRQKIRSEFDIDGEQIVIGAVSRLVEFKGHIFLLRAFKELTEKYHSIKLLIVGDGPLEDSLKIEAAKLGLSNHIIFTGHRNDLSDILSSMDIFTQTSIDFGGESFPIAMLDAMSVGLPLIASDVGDLKYMVEKNNGLLIEPKNITQITSSLKLMIESEKLRKDFGSTSRKIFLEKFTLQKMIDTIESLYLKELGLRV
jgi:L-malate glycosyltransferase